MKSTLSVGILALLVAMLIVPNVHAIMMEVVPSIGPNSGSPSWSAYRSNEIASLRGLPVNNTGGPGDYFVLDSSITPAEMSTTTAPNYSWLGENNPPAPYDLETGNRLIFGLKIVADPGQKVKLSDIVYRRWSTDSGPIFSSSTLFTYASYSYSTSMVGVNNGVLVTSGSGTQEVDAIYLTGTTLGFIPTQRLLAEERAPFTVNVIYGLGSLDGPNTAQASVQVIPEPGAFSFLAAGLLSLLRRRR